MRWNWVAIGILLCCGGIPAEEAPPTIKPYAEVMELDEIGLYDVGYAYRTKPEVHFPLGWSGEMEAHSGVCCKAVGTQQGRKAFLLHCPWRGGTGVTFQQFAFDFTGCSEILLRGATALGEGRTEKSDGVTFRVFVNGTKLLDVHRTDTQWKDFEFNLNAYAGKRGVIRFETDPGPQDNASFDFSVWGNRTLVVKGFKSAATDTVAAPAPDLAQLTSTANGSVAPPNAFAGKTTVSIADSVATLKYSGSDGAFGYRWELPKSGSDPLLGELTVQVLPLKGDGKPIELNFARDVTIEWTGKAEWQSSRWEHTDDSATCVSTYSVGGQPAVVRMVGKISGKTLQVEFSCDKPVITRFDAGHWGPMLRSRRIVVPYLSSMSVEYLPSDNLFVSSQLDWTASTASAHDGMQAHYDALTDGSRRPLQERAAYSVAWNLDEVLPNIPNAPSPKLSAVSGKLVVDVWGGKYAEIAKKLEQLHAMGLSDCIVLIHDWQNSGYDNGLPTHLPANTKLGGDEAMKTLTATARKLGYVIGLHENYVDYYTNCEKFDEQDIAFDSAGKRITAWYNEGTKMQSFAVRPSAMLRLAKTQSPEIHARFGTSAMFLDVNSSVPPWFHVDHRPGESDTGMFKSTWDTHRALWAMERQTHDGPVFGEGGNHWFWSGCLDGVEAELKAGWDNNRGRDVPLCVDFDLLKIHPLQCNHGMGYFERWIAEDRGPDGMLTDLDQYRMQELIFGHAGLLASRFYTTPQLAWLEHHLTTPVARRYGTEKAAKIEYEVDGTWRDSTAAAKANQWNRVRVTYGNGLVLTANGAATELKAGANVLPQFGWAAEGAGVTAYTAMREGVICDFAATPESIFANARNALDWNLTNAKHILPVLENFTPDAKTPGAVNFSYRWSVNETELREMACFVHILGTEGEKKGQIVLQQDHALPTSTTQWKAREEIKDGPYSLNVSGLKAGDYRWTIGLYSKEDGSRIRMQGADAGENRIALGTLHLREGAKPVFEIEKVPESQISTRLNIAGKVVDFGSVRTDGSALLRKEGAVWKLFVMPASRRFQLEYSVAKFAPPKTIRCSGGTEATVQPVVHGDWWSVPLNGASQYEWDAQ